MMLLLPWQLLLLLLLFFWPLPALLRKLHAQQCLRLVRPQRQTNSRAGQPPWASVPGPLAWLCRAQSPLTQGLHRLNPYAHFTVKSHPQLPCSSLPSRAPMPMEAAVEPYPSQPLASQSRGHGGAMCLLICHLREGLRLPFTSGGYVHCGTRSLSDPLCATHCLQQRCARLNSKAPMWPMLCTSRALLRRQRHLSRDWHLGMLLLEAPHHRGHWGLPRRHGHNHSG